MKKQQVIKKLALIMAVMGVMSNSLAAGFQLWEQEGASIGNYHAGRAAIADDASTNFYNPAGLVRIHNQQLLLGINPITTDFRFRGTLAVNTLSTGAQPVTAQGGTFNFLPNMHYAAPLADNLVFGFSIMTPFGLKTNYGTRSIARYAATLTSLSIIDFAPSLGFAYNDKIAVGFGLDIEHGNSEFDLVGTALSSAADTLSKNTGSSNNYGYHLGVLYQASPQARVGLSYQSKVTHHLHGGGSDFSGPLANNGASGTQYTNSLNTNITLPATSTLSLFQRLDPNWDVMGTVIYTQWNSLQNLILQNVAGISGGLSSNSIVLTIPEKYRNTWNYSIGANYHLNEQWFFRTGVGYDETPTNDQDRNLQLPDSNRIAIAVGSHFQATKTLGFDLGWTHIFAMNTRINNLSQAVGDQVTRTNGSISASADVYGLEMRWDIL
jgi:long-chain fatty acid transport protein